MIYEAECGAGHPFEYSASVQDYKVVPPCPMCGAVARKVIRTAARGVVLGKFDAFTSPVDGTLISSARDLKEHNRRNGVVNLNDGYSEEKIKSGQIGEKPQQESKAEKAKDVMEAIHAVKNGYKPKVEVQDE